MAQRLSKAARILFAGLFVVSFFAIAETSDAATCASLSIDNNIVSNSGCEIGSVNQDSQAQVNSDAIFGLSDWVFLARDDGPNGTTNSGSGLTISENPAMDNLTDAGQWAVAASVFSIYDSVMLVFKAGNGNIVPDDYVAYLITDLTGAYTSSFVNGNNGGLTDISHISLYGSLTVVPLPAALPLFGAALAGMGLLGWRRRRAEI